MFLSFDLFLWIRWSDRVPFPYSVVKDSNLQRLEDKDGKISGFVTSQRGLSSFYVSTPSSRGSCTLLSTHPEVPETEQEVGMG